MKDLQQLILQIFLINIINNMDVINKYSSNWQTDQFNIVQAPPGDVKCLRVHFFVKDELSEATGTGTLQTSNQIPKFLHGLDLFLQELILQ